MTIAARHAVLLGGVFVVSLSLRADSTPNLNGADDAAIDRSCAPCQDFYQFAMGKWHADNPIPADMSNWGKSVAAASRNLDVLKQILEGDSAKDSAAATFYAACTDTAAIDAAGTAPIRVDLRRIARVKTPRDVADEFAQLLRTGMAAPIDIAARPHPQKPDETVAEVTFTGLLGLPGSEYYIREDAKSVAVRARYEALIGELFAALGQRDISARAIVELEQAFARSARSNVEKRNASTIAVMSPSDLSAAAPRLRWKAYFNSLRLPFDGPIRVGELALIREIDRQLEMTPTSVWRAYLSWVVLRTAAPHLPMTFREKYADFYDTYLAGQTQRSPRWRTCVQLADASLGDAVGELYVRETFTPAARVRVVQLFENVRSALADAVRESDWMGPDTKREALQKVERIRAMIGYPDQWHSYVGPPMKRRAFLDDVRYAMQFRHADAVNQIGKPTDRSRWFITVPTFNAYYQAARNVIVVPAGRLVPPMFSVDADDAANYGAIGAVIGHEITHALDDAGSQFDSDGRVRDWWTPEDRKRFLERAQCVVDQFEGYSVEDRLHHNGKFVLGESIADLAGLRIALAAYRKAANAYERRVPAQDAFTGEQRVFLAYAQFRGNAERIEHQRRMILTDPHPTAPFRVNGPTSNMDEFHEAFGCKDGSPMVRSAQARCRIW